MKQFTPNRRRFLRGLGACVALPAFESLLRLEGPSAAAATTGGARLATTATGAPLRFAVCYVPNGTIQPAFWPTGEGKDFTFAPTMEPLKALRDQVQVFSGLDHLNATAGKDGGGDHARASGVFLTGGRVKKTAGADIHAGVSIDQ